MKKTVYMTAIIAMSGMMLTGCNAGAMTGDLIKPTNQAMTEFAKTSDSAKAAYESVNEVLSQANMVYDYLKEGHCFIACEDGKALLLFYTGDDVVMESVSRGNGGIKVKNIDGQWDKVLSDLNILDVSGTTYEDYSWDISQEGDLIVINLSNNKNKVTFYELSGHGIKDGETLAKKYVKVGRNLEDVEDINTVLEDYEGTSVVDAFILNGLSADFATRAMAAEKLGIEDYKGTAQQNEELIKLLGGKLK